jgi:hypothetical protein
MGFYVGVYRPTLDADGAYVDLRNQFACAYSESAEPTAMATALVLHQPPGHRHRSIGPVRP